MFNIFVPRNIRMDKSLFLYQDNIKEIEHTTHVGVAIHCRTAYQILDNTGSSTAIGNDYRDC